jgi:DNA-binding MarR family transcriptional regulator
MPAARRPSDTAFDLADRLHSAAIHLLRRVRRHDAAAGVSGPSGSALSVVVFRGPLTISELADAEQVRAPTMTRLVSAMELAGLVERLADPDDRRVVRVRATTRGKAILENARRQRVESLAADLEALPAKDMGTLRQAVAVLEQVVGPRSWSAKRQASE